MSARKFGTWTVVATRTTMFVVIVALWLWGAATGRIDSFFFGEPSEIWQTLVDWTLDGSIFRNALATLYEATAGFVIALVFAVPIGIGLARSPFWGRVFEPFIDMANSTPRFALAPLFVLFFGLGVVPKIVLVFSVVFFVMLISVIAGASSVEVNHLRFAALVGVTRWQMLSKVILPATTNWLIAGMRISAPYSIGAAVVGEMISSTKGLGFLIVKNAGLLETSKVLAAVLFLAVAGWALNLCLTWLFKKLPWAAQN